MSNVPRVTRNCKVRGCNNTFECGKYSKRKYCAHHIEKKVLQNTRNLRKRRGRSYIKWLENLKRGTDKAPVN
jgi:hypothetical protein